MKKLKVNIVVGGVFHAIILAERLLKLGIDAVIYTSTPKFKFKGKINPRRIVYVPKLFQLFRKLTKKNSPRWTKYLDSLFFDLTTSVIMRRCDVLHGFSGNSLICGKKTKKKGGLYFLDRACPHCLYQNSILVNEAADLNIKFHSSNRNTVRKSLKEYEISDLILVPSEYSYKSFIEQGIDEKKLYLAPLEANIKPCGGKKPEKKNNIFTVGIAGGSLLRKGFIYILRAWDMLSLSDARLLVRTDRHKLMALKEIREIVGRNKNIVFLGYMDDIKDFYRQCDIFCLSSIDEGYGMVVPEAMANFLPVIATDHVGSSSLIKDNFNGFVIPVKDHAKLAEKIMYFYKNSKEIERMGSNAYKAYLNYLSSEDSYRARIHKLYITIQKS